MLQQRIAILSTTGEPLLLSSRAALLDLLKEALLVNQPSVVFQIPSPDGGK